MYIEIYSYQSYKKILVQFKTQFNTYSDLKQIKQCWKLSRLSMVEYNKYDDLKEQQVISNIIYSITLSEPTQQIDTNIQM